MEKLSKFIFKYRSYTPIPFLLVMLYFQEATPLSLVIGFFVSLVGEFFRLWGVSVAGSETRTTGDPGGTYLVVSGAFAHVRNPLYLGNILLYTGVGIMSMALFPYLQIIAFVYFYFQYRVIIWGEEKYLRETFGKDFEDYVNNVPRFIPRLSSYKNKNVVQPEFDIAKGLKSEKDSLLAFFSVTVILMLFYFLSR